MAVLFTGNLGAFLDMIAVSEIGPNLLASSDNGYNVIVGGMLFHDYSDHPRVLVPFPKFGIKSTAAGRYQLLSRYYDAYKKTLNLPDFSPASQDMIAVQQIKEQGAYKAINAGMIPLAINLCANIWASLPGAGYGQHEQKEEYLIAQYQKSGGALA